MEYLLAVIMGLVEGLTEFLPVSSTGHLILTDYLLGFKKAVGDEEFAKTFEIVIQLGAILAVVAAYPRRFTGLLRLGDNRGFSGLRGIGLLVITTIPAGLLGLAVGGYIRDRLFNIWTVTPALAIGGVWILLVEWRRPRSRIEEVDELTWRQALGVGLFQCLALWPGMSRAGWTIPGGMVIGMGRRAATEYSFYAAVPIMIAASAWDLHKHVAHFDAGLIGILAVGMAVSFLCAWVAVKVFLRFVGRHSLVAFGWYRLALAAVILLAAGLGGLTVGK
jgi:undecaprenyl-diphosphatase